jgi:hypothetical protein
MQILPNGNRVLLTLIKEEKGLFDVPNSENKRLATVEAVGTDVINFIEGDIAILPRVYDMVDIDETEVIFLEETALFGKYIKGDK